MDKHATYHKEKHNGYVQCSSCDKMFRGNYELRKHIETIHEQLRFTCSICNRQFKSKDGLKYHQNLLHITDNKFKCKFCSLKFSNKQRLLIHERKDHDIGKLSCKHCKNSFVYTWKYNSHLNCCKAIPGGDLRIWVCSKCRKRFHKFRYLKQHRQSCLQKKGFECVSCSKRFNHRSGLNYHRKLCKN